MSCTHVMRTKFSRSLFSYTEALKLISTSTSILFLHVIPSKTKARFIRTKYKIVIYNCYESMSEVDNKL